MEVIVYGAIFHRWHIHMTIKSKIYLSFSVLVALFVLNGIATILTLNENKRLGKHTVEVLMPSSDALDSLTLVLMGSKMYSTNWVYLRDNNADKQSLMVIEDRQYSELKQKLNFYRRQWDDPRWTDRLGHIIGGFEYLLAVDRRIMEMLK